MTRIEPYVSAVHDDAELPYQGIGVELRRARESTGQSADQVASALRIRRPHIQAIEDGRFNDLPGQVYAVGFIRAYADYLGLDANIVIDRFHEEADETSPKLELHFPEPASRRSRLDLRALLVGLIIAVGAYGAWNYLQTEGQIPQDLVAVVPPNLLVADSEDATNSMAGAEQEASSTIHVVPSQTPALRTSETPAVGGPSSLPPPQPGAGLRIAEPNGGDVPLEASALGEPEVTPDEPDAAAIAMQRLLEADDVAAGETEGLDEDLSTDSAAAIAALTEEPATIASGESETQLPPTSDALEGFRLGETVEDEPGSATPITGALVEAPEAPTLVENELPSVPQAPAVTYEPRIYGQGNTDARVVVRARIESWVQIEGADNELLLTRVLNPGDMFLVPNRADLRLVTGNAGGIEILVDGVLMPPLGPEGTVRRNVRLTPDALTGSDTVSAR